MSNKPKLKIGLVFDDSLDSNDGVQQYVKSLGRWLIAQGNEVRFLVGETKNSGEFQQNVHSLSRNIKVAGNQNKMFLPLASSGKKITGVLEDEQFDVLHIMMPFNPIMGSRVIRRAQNTPIVASFHMVGGTSFINYGAKLLSLVQSSTISKVDTFLSVSSAAQAFEKKHFGIDSTISPNMVDIEPFKEGVAIESLRGKNGTIVFLGRLVERKGAQHLLKSLKLLSSAGGLDGVLVHLCGDGELRSELEQYVKNNSLENNVVFHGFIDEADKANFLATADIAVFPATGGEAFGIVLIEAMATGQCVVLGGNNAGYATVLGDRPELLFDPLDHTSLMSKLQTYLKDTEKAQSALAWQGNAVKQYDVNVVGKNIETIYRETIAKKSV